VFAVDLDLWEGCQLAVDRKRLTLGKLGIEAVQLVSETCRAVAEDFCRSHRASSYAALNRALLATVDPSCAIEMPIDFSWPQYDRASVEQARLAVGEVGARFEFRKVALPVAVVDDERAAGGSSTADCALLSIFKSGSSDRSFAELHPFVGLPPTGFAIVRRDESRYSIAGAWHGFGHTADPLVAFPDEWGQIAYARSGLFRTGYYFVNVRHPLASPISLAIKTEVAFRQFGKMPRLDWSDDKLLSWLLVNTWQQHEFWAALRDQAPDVCTKIRELCAPAGQALRWIDDEFCGMMDSEGMVNHARLKPSGPYVTFADGFELPWPSDRRWIIDLEASRPDPDQTDAA
jgi:hypothetical protein